MENFRALLITRDEATKKQSVGEAVLTSADLMDGDVDVRVDYSTINYKDGLAITGTLPVVRRFPMIPGVDLAGTVTASSNPGFKPGDKVILNGWGVGEVHLGAFSQMARVKGDWLIPLPAGLDGAEARAELAGPAKPLAKERWAGAIDAVGGTMLANIISMIGYHGAVAACGNAGGMELPTSVAPFILRGISLLGIDSVRQPKAVRIAAWDRLAKDLDPKKLAAMTTRIPFSGIVNAAHDIMAGKVRGRLVVDIG